MINIITNASKYKDDEIIRDNESFFINNIRAKDFKDDSLKAMKTIDNAILIDVNTNKIETPYGICSIDDLSTGCKTILNYLFIKSFPNLYPTIRAIDATGCGYNALEELFKLIEANNDNIEILLQHKNNLYKCSDRQYKINNKSIIESLLYL